MMRWAAAVLLVSSFAWAQGPAASASGPVTVDGCVQGSGGRITLFRNNTAAAFLLMGDDAQLAQLDGHQVRITGSELPPSDNRPPNDMPRLRVQKVEVLGANCPPGQSSGAAVPSNNPPAATASPDFRRPGAPPATAMPPGSDANINSSPTNAGGAPSAGTNDPRNLSPSPPPIPSEVEQQTKPDSGKHAKKKKHGQESTTTANPH